MKAKHLSLWSANLLLLLFHGAQGFTIPSIHRYNNVKSLSKTRKQQKNNNRHNKQRICIHNNNNLRHHYGLKATNVVVGLAESLLRPEGNIPFLQSFGLNAILFASLSSKLFSMLTPTGFAHAMALGTMLWTTLGWKGWTLCVLYLFLGQAVTKVKFEEKKKRGIAEGRGGRRGPENVWGSAATALICAACAAQGSTFLGLGSKLYLLGYVASLSTKLADTFASEIGKAYGKTTFLITTFERVEPGTEGAVSAEGTAASVVGGLMLALYGYAIGFLTLPGVAIATVSAFLATNVESVLGATLQGKDNLNFMTNEVINFINTLIGAIIAMVAGSILLPL